MSTLSWGKNSCPGFLARPLFTIGYLNPGAVPDIQSCGILGVDIHSGITGVAGEFGIIGIGIVQPSVMATIATRHLVRYAGQPLVKSGKPELYDMELDPGQSTNVYGHPDYDEAAAELDKELDIFFREYSTAQYDLWRGGTAKGSVIRPENNNAYLS